MYIICYSSYLFILQFQICIRIIGIHGHDSNSYSRGVDQLVCHMRFCQLNSHVSRDSDTIFTLVCPIRDKPHGLEVTQIRYIFVHITR